MSDTLEGFELLSHTARAHRSGIKLEIYGNNLGDYVYLLVLKAERDTEEIQIVLESFKPEFHLGDEFRRRETQLIGEGVEISLSYRLIFKVNGHGEYRFRAPDIQRQVEKAKAKMTVKLEKLKES